MDKHHETVSEKFAAVVTTTEIAYNEFRLGNPEPLQWKMHMSGGGYICEVVVRKMAEDPFITGADISLATDKMHGHQKQSFLDKVLALYAEQPGKEFLAIALMEAGANPAKVEWKNPVMKAAVASMQARVEELARENAGLKAAPAPVAAKPG